MIWLLAKLIPWRVAAAVALVMVAATAAGIDVLQLAADLLGISLSGDWLDLSWFW